MDVITISPTVGIRISADYYNTFMAQQAKGENKKDARDVFIYDYQRFVWAFILGIKSGERKPLLGKTESAFKWQIINNRTEIARLIIGLCLQEKYGDNPKALKEDFEKQSKGELNLGEDIRTMVEEYANKGFEIIMNKTALNLTYIEDFETIVKDILDNENI